MTPESGGVRARGPRILIALGYPSAREALAMAVRIDPGRCRVKLGNALFVRSPRSTPSRPEAADGGRQGVCRA